MRISTRVGLGLGIVCALSATALGWQWSRIARLADALHDLARVKLPATEVSVNLLDLSDLIEIRIRKYRVTRDPEYAAAARRACQQFDATVADLVALRENGYGVPGVGALAQAWQGSRLSEGIDGDNSDAAVSTWAAERIDVAELELQALRHEIALVLRAAREESSRQVARSTAITVRALNVSGATLVIVLAISAAVTLFTVTSINRPIRELLAATKAVAEGKFGHRIETPARTELAVLADHFNTMVARLDELDRLKRDFLSNVSHEIKTPLVAMQETTRLLLDEVPGPLSDKQRRIVELQSQGQLRLQRMISDLLDMSCMEAGVMSYAFEDVDIRPVVTQALEAFEPVAAERGIRLAKHVDADHCPIRCDPLRITQVVHNLVENAIRFSPEGGTVTLRVERQHNRTSPTRPVKVTVSDQGIGVPDHHKTLVFERFYQVKDPRAGSLSRSFGLGLAICQRIVAAHGGRIWVEDGAAGGAAFAFELPAVDAVPDQNLNAPDDGGSS